MSFEGYTPLKIFPSTYLGVPEAHTGTLSEKIEHLEKPGLLNGKPLSRHPGKSMQWLYKDDNVVLYPDRIVVAWFYLPFGNAKTIPLAHILGAGLPEQMNVTNVHTWGMGKDKDVWWASDLKRGQQSVVTVLCRAVPCRGHARCQ